MKSEKIKVFVPNYLKFRATHNGVEVKDGDHWTPRGMSNAQHCHPVRISSAGIHWTKKLDTHSSGFVIGKDGTHYYADWENINVHSMGVKLEIITRRVALIEDRSSC